MRKRKKNKFYIIVVLVLCISVGFAILSTNLNFNLLAHLKNSNWDVHFTNLKVDTGSIEATMPATITDDTTIEFAADFAREYDYYQFTFDIVNDGKIDAMVSNFTSDIFTAEQEQLLEYTLTYDDGTPIQMFDGIQAGQKRKAICMVKYKDYLSTEEIGQLKSIDLQNLTLTASIEYIKADENVSLPTVNQVYMKNLSNVSEIKDNAWGFKSVKILDYMYVPDNYTTVVDISEAKDGSIMAYLVSNTELYIVSDGMIMAPADSTNLFPFNAATSIEGFNNINMSEVVNATGMFLNCNNVNALDLSNADFSNVTTYTDMFPAWGSLQEIIVKDQWTHDFVVTALNWRASQINVVIA